MNIGIDIRALQTGHRFRGIGEVTKQVTNRIIKKANKDNHKIIFYEYLDSDPKEILNIPKDLNHRTIKVGKNPENDKNSTKFNKLKRNLKELYGNPIARSGEADVFVQFDYAFGVPKNTRTVLIKHDLIPYVFWNSFFESAWVPFKNKALRTTLRTVFANYKFNRILKRSLKNANKIISVSDSTKKDIIRFFNIDDSKIDVVPLGVDTISAVTSDTNNMITMPTKPYLIFVGAGDERRRVDELVAAYNNLKADGYDIQLVLVGENFKEPKQIPNKRTRDAVLLSSYPKDILTMGYVDDATKQRLFRGAVAFVYPTQYEGFGIPILEAFLLETPVITYKNSSIPEVGGDQAIYADDWTDILKEAKTLLGEDKEKRQKRIDSAKKYVKKFTWDKTADNIYRKVVKE